METAERQRIDKWLWFARFARTRSLAQKLILAGSIRVNREKVEAPSRLVHAGDVLTVVVGREVRVLKIVGIGERRGPAPEARLLYEEIATPAPVSTGGGSRPTKRDRRAIDREASWVRSEAPPGGTDFPYEGED